MDILLAVLALVGGFVALIKGADWFVEGSSSVAKLLKVPTIVIGLTVVALGTSLPEASVSISSALAGKNAMAISNVVGSNLFNTLVVLGASALIVPVCVQPGSVKKEIPYIKQVDIGNAPVEFRNRPYPTIPAKYKKHRVEYRIEESRQFTAVDKQVNEFFEGYERVYSPMDVAERVLNFATDIVVDTPVAPTPAPKAEPSPAVKPSYTAPPTPPAPTPRYTPPPTPPKPKPSPSSSPRVSSTISLNTTTGGYTQHHTSPSNSYSTTATKTSIIKNVCSLGSRNFDNPFPNDANYGEVIDRDRYNVVYFHLSLFNETLRNKSSIKAGFNIYNANNQLVYESSNDYRWQPSFDKLGLGWVIRGKDNSFVNAGLYRAEFWVEDSETFEYTFKVTSSSTTDLNNNRYPKSNGGNRNRNDDSVGYSGEEKNYGKVLGAALLLLFGGAIAMSILASIGELIGVLLGIVVFVFLVKNLIRSIKKNLHYRTFWAFLLSTIFIGYFILFLIIVLIWKKLFGDSSSSGCIS